MSRLLRGTTAAAGLVAMAAAALAGQTPDEQTRLTRLARRYEDLAARVLTAADAGAPRVDSVTLGGILILTDSIESPVFRQALESFRRSLTEGLGDSALPLLTDARITVRFGTPDPAWARLLTADAEFVGVQQADRTSEWLAAQLTHSVNLVLGRRGGAGMAAWRADLRLFEDPGPLRAATYVELLTANEPDAERCRDGALTACARALNLVPAGPERSPEALAELRRFVERRVRQRGSEPDLAPAYTACVNGGDGAACLTFLERAGIEEPTLSTRAAGTLLLTARDVGGPAAIARFFADTGAAVVPRLEDACGVPIDSLLARWRVTILAHRPPPTTVSAGGQWLVLLWVTVLVGLATRSTRWR